MSRWYRVQIWKKQGQQVLVRARGPRDAEYKLLKKLEDGTFTMNPLRTEHDCDTCGDEPIPEGEVWSLEKVE